MENQQNTEGTSEAGLKSTLNSFGYKAWLPVLLPLVLIAVAFYLGSIPPQNSAKDTAAVVEPGEFIIENIELPEPGLLQIAVFNGTDEEVTIPQVLIDDAYWDYVADPSNILPAGGKATFDLPYPWVVGELHLVRLITSRGETFDGEIVAPEGSEPVVSAEETPAASKQ